MVKLNSGGTHYFSTWGTHQLIRLCVPWLTNMQLSKKLLH